MCGPRSGWIRTFLIRSGSDQIIQIQILIWIRIRLAVNRSITSFAVLADLLQRVQQTWQCPTMLVWKITRKKAVPTSLHYTRTENLMAHCMNIEHNSTNVDIVEIQNTINLTDKTSQFPEPVLDHSSLIHLVLSVFLVTSPCSRSRHAEPRADVGEQTRWRIP